MERESRRVEISAGQVEWEEPTERIHRAVNVSKQPYEQVTVFLLDRPDAALGYGCLYSTSCLIRPVPVAQDLGPHLQDTGVE